MAKKTIPISGSEQSRFIKKALAFAQTQSHFSYYQNNQIPYPYDGFGHVLAIGAQNILKTNAGTAFEELKAFHQNKWLFGYLGYDLKNEIETLSSNNPNPLGFSDLYFFEPSTLLFIDEESVTMEGEDVLETILRHEVEIGTNVFYQPQASFTKEAYTTLVKTLRDHIKEGDCYEINLCQDFLGSFECIDPLNLYLRLNEVSPKPFSCFQKFDEQLIISASPERFLKKTGAKVVSQPIKGTRPRFHDALLDKQQKDELRYSEKEMAENMMIVDLVRNDLARTAKTGSVKVEEMFGIYSFQQVHQMISTIGATIRDDTHFVDVIKHAFPMGSMTGAPKVKVMELIEKYENAKRGAFSGAAGYITPEGDFDFNVLIRSLFIDIEKQLYGFFAGGAITYDSIPEEEYEECLVKAKAINQVLKGLTPVEKPDLYA